MSQLYDSRTTILSPEGRLYQVEYAMEAVSHAGTVIGITCDEGIVMISEKQNISPLVESNDYTHEKLYPISKNIIAGIAGFTSDANILVEYARKKAQQNVHIFGREISLGLLAEKIANMEQCYTQMGGLRPFGATLLIAGYDTENKFQLYQVDPSGVHTNWKANAVGKHSAVAHSTLKLYYKDSMTIGDAMAMSVRILQKTRDMSSLLAVNIEMAVIQLDELGETSIRYLTIGDIEKLVQENNESRD